MGLANLETLGVLPAPGEVFYVYPSIRSADGQITIDKSARCVFFIPMGYPWTREKIARLDAGSPVFILQTFTQESHIISHILTSQGILTTDHACLYKYIE